MKIWIRDQTAHSKHSDLDLHCPYNLLVLSVVRKEITGLNICCFEKNDSRRLPDPPPVLGIECVHPGDVSPPPVLRPMKYFLTSQHHP